MNKPRQWPFMSQAFAEPQDSVPMCAKCGAPITTGAMAILCQLGKDCALRDEGNAESVDFFREAFATDAPAESPYCDCDLEPTMQEEATRRCQSCGKEIIS